MLYDGIDGDFIKKLRSDLNISMAEFARIFHVSSPTVHAWERGEALPDPYKQHAIIQLRKKLDDHNAEKIRKHIKTLLFAGGLGAILIWLFSEE